MSPTVVSTHAFSPLIFYSKEEKRYKSSQKKTIVKIRPIMYASHRDACILSYYAHQVNCALEEKYKALGITENVIAYRSLGRSNYHFASEAYDYAKKNSPVKILAFDVTGFFDNLDHNLLKQRLKALLGFVVLPLDWYKIIRYITRFHSIRLDDLKKNQLFLDRINNRKSRVIGTIAEVKKAGINISPNPKSTAGIPQGTPISACLSNLYMIDFDIAMKNYCDSIGAYYRRYSDDILIICKPNYEFDTEENPEKSMPNYLGVAELTRQFK